MFSWYTYLRVVIGRGRGKSGKRGRGGREEEDDPQFGCVHVQL
jgi:hypothetical protein